MSKPADHRLVEVRPVPGRGRHGFTVHCSCGWTSGQIMTAGMASGAHERHQADPDAVSDDYH